MTFFSRLAYFAADKTPQIATMNFVIYVRLLQRRDYILCNLPLICHGLKPQNKQFYTMFHVLSFDRNAAVLWKRIFMFQNCRNKHLFNCFLCLFFLRFAFRDIWCRFSYKLKALSHGKKVNFFYKVNNFIPCSIKQA